MTGATSVHLLLWSEDLHDWLLSAPGAGTVPVSGTGRERAVPMSVLRYVQRTREPLVVGDAPGDDRFARDPYFADVGSCSLLALPILSRGLLRAVPIWGIAGSNVGRLPQRRMTALYTTLDFMFTNAQAYR